MGFTSITGTLLEIIVDIYNKFVALDEFETVFTDPANHIWAWKKLDDNTFISLRTNSRFYSESNYYSGFTGLEFTISSEWNSTTNVHAGTINPLSVQMGMQDWTGNNNDAYGGNDTVLERTNNYATRVFTFNYWLDKYGIIGAFQNPYSMPSCVYSTACIFGLEFIPTISKEFDDGLNNTFGFTIGSRQPEGRVCNKAIRGYIAKSGYYHLFLNTRDAYKGIGNNQIYFDFPYYFNDFSTNAYNTPSARTKRWFYVEKVDSGLVAGDVVNYIDTEAAVTRKFIVVEVIGVNTVSNSFYAIPYENAAIYEPLT